MNKIAVPLDDGRIFLLAPDNYARWLCLIEGLDCISRKAEEKNIDLDKDSSWIQPIALQKYIDERFPSMLHDVKIEQERFFNPIET